MVVSSDFPGRPFALQIDSVLVSQNIAANYSRFYGWARIHKNSYSPTWSNSPVSAWETWTAGIRLAITSGLTFDFRNGTDFQLWDGYFDLNHSPDGTMPAYTFDAYANYDLLGYAEVHMPLSAPRIPRGPRVRSGGAWRNSVAYVRSGGAWRIAVPYVRSGGAWRIGGG